MAFFAAYYPVFIELVKSWSGSEDNSHGFAIIPIAGYIIWQKRGVLPEPSSKGSSIGLIFIVISAALYIFAQLGKVVTLSSISMIAVLWGMILFLFGFKMLQAMMFPLAFLLFMIPVPAQIYSALTIPLQLLVTKVTVGLADLAGIPIYREGNVIHIPERTLQVVQACSGLRSIMTMLTLGAVFGYFTLKSVFTRGVLLVAGVPIAVAVNIVRVMALVVAFHYFRIDLSEGALHTALGLGVFLLALGIFILVQRGLARCEQ